MPLFVRHLAASRREVYGLETLPDLQNARHVSYSSAEIAVIGGVLGLIRRVMHLEKVVSVETLEPVAAHLGASGDERKAQWACGKARTPGRRSSRSAVSSTSSAPNCLRHSPESQGRETAVELGTRAQISIDILIRNLFERTADVGFLAEDGAIIDSLAAAENTERRS